MEELSFRKGTASVFLRYDAEPEIQELRLSPCYDEREDRNPLDRMEYFLE